MTNVITKKFQTGTKGPGEGEFTSGGGGCSVLLRKRFKDEVD